MKYLGLAVAVTFLLFVAEPGFAQGKFFDSNGVRIRYVEQGTGDPIVLLSRKRQYVDRCRRDCKSGSELPSDCL
jgi:hypothetical protein